MSKYLNRFLSLGIGLLLAGILSVDAQKITFHNERMTLKKAFERIEQVSKYKIQYNSSQLDENRVVMLNQKNTEILKALSDILSGTGYTYVVKGYYIIIMKSKEKSDNKVYPHSAIRQSNRHSVIGIVTDEKGEPIIGASIRAKNVKMGTVSDLDGKFSIDMADNGQLEVSYVGFQNQVIHVGNRRNISIVLKENAQSLNELVVVGYGTVKRSDLTGSVSSLNSDNLTAASQTNAIDAMQGKISGVNITRNAARPGGSYNITIRGLGSINNNNGPLWVIDGIPSSSDARDLNPADIEKIDVLKDASATAIYGSRGANGVVIVTTKQGKSGHVSIDYDGYYGLRVASHLPDMMNADQYMKFRTELFRTQGKSTDRSNAEFFTPEEWNRIDNRNFTDWVDLVLRTGQQYSNTLTASGGDDKGNFTIGIGQLHEEGTVKDQDYNRYNMHINVNHNFLTKWQCGGMLYFTYSKQNEGSYETLRSAYRLPSMTNPYDEDGNLLYHCYRNDAVTNPLLESTKDGEHRENKRYRVFGNIHLQFKPVKGITFRTQFSPQMLYTRNGIYIGTNAKNSVGHKATVTADYNQSQYWSYVWDNQATYETRIRKHYLNASIVQSIQMEQWEKSNQEVKNLPFNSLWYNLDAANLSDVTKSGTDFQKRTLSSVLARVQYSYDDRYLLTVSGRYDGSSRLSKGNKWSFFPSAALAWRMMEEKFLRKVSWLSNLKLRLSCGVTGNDAVSIYGTQSGVEQLFYDFGGDVVSAYYKNGLANKNLTWEKTHEVNLGVDFGFLNSRINGSIDLYQRIAKDLIMKRNIPITSGWKSIWDNIGKVRNRGLEFALNTVNIQHQHFKWETNLNFSTNHNEIEELYGAKKDDVSNKWFIGYPVDANYDYVFDGIWQTDEADEAAKYGQKPGQVKVKDMDHNYVINSDDKRIIGHRSPSWIGSITNSFVYHDFDFSFYIYTQQGAKIQDAFMSSFMTYEGNYMQVNEDYWTPEHPSNKYPQPGNKGKYFDAMRYRDVSFVRVGSITLGYSLPKKILDRIKVKKLRVYFTTNNPFTFTSYKGFDPEWAKQNTWGTATGYTTYLMGVKLEF